jgi:hypothetical protein
MVWQKNCQCNHWSNKLSMDFTYRLPDASANTI